MRVSFGIPLSLDIFWIILWCSSFTLFVGGCLFSLMAPMQRGHPLQDSSALHHDDCFLWQSFLGGGASDVTALSHRYFGHLWKP